MSEQQELRFDAPADDPVAVYLASGLTSLSEDQLTIVELVSGLVAGFCSDAGIIVHQPVMHTHPRDHSDLGAEEVHAKDFAKVAESDAVIAIGDFASWGAGKELAWAERLRPGLLRDRVARHQERWLGLLEQLVQEAIDTGEVDTRIDPAQAAFEIHAAFVAANTALLLRDDTQAIARARAAIATTLAPPS